MELEQKEERYNELVNQIVGNKTIVSVGLYNIGLALKEIKERELYLLEFRYFEEFLEKKVELSKRTGYRCLEIATSYSLVEFKKWGLYRLEIVKREFPEEKDRKSFMDESMPSSAETEKGLIKDINEYKLNRLKNAIVSKPEESPEEQDLKLERQFLTLQSTYNDNKAHFKRVQEELIESLVNWLKMQQKAKTTTRSAKFKDTAQEMLDELEL